MRPVVTTTWPTQRPALCRRASGGRVSTGPVFSSYCLTGARGDVSPLCGTYAYG